MIFWVILFFLAGMALVIAEFFLPGMVCGILGVTAFIASAAIGISYYPDYVALIVGAEILGALFCVVTGLVLLSKTNAGKHLRLDAAQRPDQGWVSTVTDDSLKGATGVVLTQLRPAGTIEVNGKRIDAVSEGSFIDQGVQIRVVDVHGSRVVVEQIG